MILVGLAALAGCCRGPLRVRRRAIAHAAITHATRGMTTSTGRPRRLWAFADGACRGNPGPGGCGALIVDPGTEAEEGLPPRVLATRARFLGDQETNNSAEYHGLLLALELAEELHPPELVVHMDSELIVKQMRGDYRVKAPHLRALHREAQRRARALGHVGFVHVPREDNALADRLANTALDDPEGHTMPLPSQE